jgi:hypothetical protein
MLSRIARMVTSVLLIIYLSITGYSQFIIFEDGWKGIKIFETTRSEIEKKFGISKNRNAADVFTTGDEALSVIFSTNPCTITLRGRRIFNPDVASIIGYEYVIGPATKVLIRDVSNPFNEKRIFNVPRDTVVEYTAGPLTNVLLKDLKWERDQYESFDLNEGYLMYSNPALGIEVHTRKTLGPEKVEFIKYYAPADRLGSVVCK